MGYYFGFPTGCPSKIAKLNSNNNGPRVLASIAIPIVESADGITNNKAETMRLSLPFGKWKEDQRMKKASATKMAMKLAAKIPIRFKSLRVSE